MKNELKSQTLVHIEDRIFNIRGQQVMIDRDLAELYGVETKVLNQAVKRNIERFPDVFRFQLTENELSVFEIQLNSVSGSNSLRSQFVTLESQRGKHRKYLPYAFTEQGVAMLSAVLRSDTAVKVSVQIIQAFVEMRKYIADNGYILQRLERVEQVQIEANHKFEQIFNALESKSNQPEKGIFFDGQIFDAYTFVADIVRSAKSSIVLIDNYIDDSTLTLFSKRNESVDFIIYTKSISKQLKLDIEKFNAQYQTVRVLEMNLSHDRFLIIDNTTLYHIGASLKDLGKKWFAFSKMDTEVVTILNRINNL